MESKQSLNANILLLCNGLTTPGEVGGAEEDRTPDLRIANATLSQLSYGPIVYMPLRQQETTLLILSHDFSYIPPFER